MEYSHLGASLHSRKVPATLPVDSLTSPCAAWVDIRVRGGLKRRRQNIVAARVRVQREQIVSQSWEILTQIPVSVIVIRMSV